MKASVVRLPAKTAPKTGERLRPLNIPGTEALTVKQAQGVQRLSIVRGHVATLGEAMALEGDHCALNCPRQDDREHPDVQRYFRRLDIPLS